MRVGIGGAAFTIFGIAMAFGIFSPERAHAEPATAAFQPSAPSVMEGQPAVLTVLLDTHHSLPSAGQALPTANSIKFVKEECGSLPNNLNTSPASYGVDYPPINNATCASTSPDLDCHLSSASTQAAYLNLSIKTYDDGEVEASECLKVCMLSNDPAVVEIDPAKRCTVINIGDNEVRVNNDGPSDAWQVQAAKDGTYTATLSPGLTLGQVPTKVTNPSQMKVAPSREVKAAPKNSSSATMNAGQTNAPADNSSCSYTDKPCIYFVKNHPIEVKESELYISLPLLIDTSITNQDIDGIQISYYLAPDPPSDTCEKAELGSDFAMLDNKMPNSFLYVKDLSSTHIEAGQIYATEIKIPILKDTVLENSECVKVCLAKIDAPPPPYQIGTGLAQYQGWCSTAVISDND
ncbi:MAG: hypothetical protein U1F66_10130 [bacterium]